MKLAVSLSWCLLLPLQTIQAQSFEQALGLRTTYLTLQDAVHRVLQNSLDVKIEWLNVAAADRQSFAASGKFEPYYYANGSYTDSRLPQNALEFVQTGGGLVLLSEPNLFQQQNLIMEMGIAGKLPTGTQYSVFTSAARYRNDINRLRPPAVYSPEYAAAAGITLVQPLLRDFGADAQLSEVRVTRRNRAIADFKWEAQLHRVLAEVISEYLDLMLVMENVRMKQDVLLFVRNLAYQVSDRIKKGTPVDLNPQDIELALSIAEEDVIKAMMLAVDRQAKLKNQILSGSQEETGDIILARDTPRAMSVKTDRNALFHGALHRRPDYRATLEEVEKNAILVKFMANQRLPRLDLQGTLSTHGLSGGYGSAYSRATDRQGYEAQVGFRFSVPLGNRTAKANSATAEYLHHQAMLNVARAELNVKVEIATALARLRGGQARLDSARRSLRLAETAQKDGEKRHAAAQAGYGELLKTRLQVIDARTRELEALTEYNRSALQLTLASGDLLEKYGIHLQRDGTPDVPHSSRQAAARPRG